VAVVLLAVPVWLGLGCIQIDLLQGGRSPLVQSVVYSHPGPGPAAKFLLVEIDGVISLSDEAGLVGPAREGTVARVREVLDAARGDREVRGILLRIDSPGGGATPSDLVYGELLRFKRDRQLPVVAHFLGMAASGGYYVAMAADEIVAEPTAVTGSIGVIFASVNVSGLMERWGIEDQTITGGRYKDSGSMIRPQTDEDRAILQGVVNDLYERFRSVVAEGRPMLGREEVDRLADGRLYSAAQAKENGLVDRIGSIEEAVARLEARAGVEASSVVSYHRRNEWRRNLYTRASPGPPALGKGGPHPLASWLEPGFHFLWPGALSLPAALPPAP